MADVSILNGYKIKDAKAVRYYNSIEQMKSDTSIKINMNIEIKNKIYKVVNGDFVEDDNKIIELDNGLFAIMLEDMCEYIFPGNWGNVASGDSSIVRVGGKVILFDTNATQVYQNLKSMLAEYNISHIDYIIISHFDSDHRENFASLVTDGYIDSTTKYYHPSINFSGYGEETTLAYNTIETICTNNDIESIIPTENQVVDITNNTSIEFANVDLEYADDHYTTSNDASMIVKLRHNNFVTLMMADAQIETEKYLLNTNFVNEEIKMYTIPHHAINTAAYPPFYEKINPQIAVSQTFMEDFIKNKLVLNQASALLNEKGCKNYFSFDQTDNLYFIEIDNVITCMKGIPRQNVSKSASGQTIYCDSVNYDPTKQDGTQAYPYRDLSQAIGCLPDYNNIHITIHLNPGTYGTENPGGSAALKNRINIYNIKNHITIEGENPETTIISDGISINNCFKIQLENVKICNNSERTQCAYIHASEVSFRNCIFTNLDSTIRGYGIYAEDQSKIFSRACSYSYLTNANYIRNIAELYEVVCSYNNITNIYNLDSTSKVCVNSWGTVDWTTITNLDNYSSGLYPEVHYPDYRIPVSTSNTTQMLGDINIPFGNNFGYKTMAWSYELRHNNTSGGRNTKIFVLPKSNTNDLILSEFNALSQSYEGIFNMYTMVFDYSETNKKFNIKRNTKYRELADGTKTVVDVSDPTSRADGMLIWSVTLKS